MRVKDFATVKVNFPEADFWLIRKGSAEKIGSPVHQFSPEYVGVKITRTDILFPEYVFYVFVYLHSTGLLRPLVQGSLKLQHIKVSDIKNISVLA